MRSKIHNHFNSKYEWFAPTSKDESGDKVMRFMAILLDVGTAFTSPVYANRRTARAWNTI
jgi:hypothetical protein